MEKDEYMLTLDQIIDIVLNSGALGGIDPEFVRMCEKNITRELLNYTRNIAPSSQDNSISEDEAITLIEEKAVAVMDEVCETNRVYLKMGMKICAGLFFQLLEK